MPFCYVKGNSPSQYGPLSNISFSVRELHNLDPPNVKTEVLGRDLSCLLESLRPNYQRT